MVLTQPNLLLPKLTKYIRHRPTPKQLAFLLLDCEEAFYGGAAGGGKSDALLMAALQYVDKPKYDAILIRDSYKNLSEPEALIPRSHEWLQDTDAHWSGEHKRWNFPSGASLSFGYLDGPLDHFNYQSAAFQFVGIDEIVNIRENQALYMFSRLRRLIDCPDVPIRFRAASNPPTREQLERGAWVKDRYVNKYTRANDVVFVPAWLDDNPYLDKIEYRKTLAKLDPITRRQLEEGDWEIHAKGRMFDRAWFEIVRSAPIEMERVRYWDLAGTDLDLSRKNEPARTAGCKMGRASDGVEYIESMIKFQKSARYIEQIVAQTAYIDGQEVRIYMEQEPGSSGKNLIDFYRRKILSQFAFYGNPAQKSKIANWMPFASYAEAGNVKLVEGYWVPDFLDEIELVPDGQFKDQADAAAGAHNVLGQIIGVEPRFTVV